MSAINEFNFSRMQLFMNPGGVDFEQELMIWVQEASPGEERAEAANRMRRVKEKNLNNLDLSHLNLSSLPHSFGCLTSLKELDLSHNRLKIVPSAISRLDNLENLNLNSNQLTLIPAHITQLTHLLEIHLEDNAFALLPREMLTLQRQGVSVFLGHHFIQNHLYELAWKGWRQDLKTIFSLLTHPQKIELLSFQDPSGSTLLHKALWHHHSESISAILLLELSPEEKSRIINIQDKQGSTALHLAIHYKQNFDILRLLIESGADLYARDSDGITPLDMVRIDRLFPLIPFLLQRGALPHSLAETGSLGKSLAKAERVQAQWEKFKVTTHKTGLLAECSHTNRDQRGSLFILHPKYSHNKAFKIYPHHINFDIDILTTWSRYFYHTHLYTVDSVEEAIRQLRARKSDLLIVRGHGAGEDPTTPASLGFGAPRQPHTPVLFTENQAWREAVQQHMKKKGTLVFDSCGSALEQEGNRVNLCEEAADLFEDSEGITIVGSDKSFSYQLCQPGLFPPIRFFAHVSYQGTAQGEESTVVYQQQSRVKYRDYADKVVIEDYFSPPLQKYQARSRGCWFS